MLVEIPNEFCVAFAISVVVCIGWSSFTILQLAYDLVPHEDSNNSTASYTSTSDSATTATDADEDEYVSEGSTLSLVPFQGSGSSTAPCTSDSYTTATDADEDQDEDEYVSEDTSAGSATATPSTASTQRLPIYTCLGLTPTGRCTQRVSVYGFCQNHTLQIAWLHRTFTEDDIKHGKEHCMAQDLKTGKPCGYGTKGRGLYQVCNKHSAMELPTNMLILGEVVEGEPWATAKLRDLGWQIMRLRGGATLSESTMRPQATATRRTFRGSPPPPYVPGSSTSSASSFSTLSTLSTRDRRCTVMRCKE